MKAINIGFIGGGNMARSLIGGLLDTGWDPRRILVCEPETDKREFFEQRMNTRISGDNERAVKECELVVLAVKPQVLRQVCTPLADLVQAHRPLCVSIAAGVTLPDIDRWLGGDVAIVRAMPNTPALVGSGATALYAGPRVAASQRDAAETLLRSVGTTVWLDDESLLHVVTGLSGSGPAYFMLVMEALQSTAEAHGLPAQTARLLTVETCLGAAKLALESGEDLAELRRRVTSPGGTTEAALKVMQEHDLAGILNRGLNAAAQRSRELAIEFGKQ